MSEPSNEELDTIRAVLTQLNHTHDTRLLAAALGVYSARLYKSLIAAGLETPDVVKQVYADNLADALTPPKTAPTVLYATAGPNTRQ